MGIYPGKFRKPPGSMRHVQGFCGNKCQRRWDWFCGQTEYGDSLPFCYPLFTRYGYRIFLVQKK